MRLIGRINSSGTPSWKSQLIIKACVDESARRLLLAADEIRLLAEFAEQVYSRRVLATCTRDKLDAWNFVI